MRESYEAPRQIILPLQKVTAFLERCNASRGARTVVPTTANRDYHARANLAKSLPTKPDACPNQVAQVAIATLRYLAEDRAVTGRDLSLQPGSRDPHHVGRQDIRGRSQDATTAIAVLSV